MNLPGFLGSLEPRVREITQKHILRGKVDVYIRFRERDSSMKVTADIGAAVGYAEAIKSVAAAVGAGTDIPLSLIIAQEGVLNVRRETDADSVWLSIQPLLEEAFTVFSADREREGENLAHDIFLMIGRIKESLAVFQSWAGHMEETFRENIKKRFAEIVGDGADEQRVMQETAALLIKYTINEEIVRLSSHISALEKELHENAAPGRKIDFICQEINREINTIGSKNQIAEVGQAVIAAKDALENIREQARNIE